MRIDRPEQIKTDTLKKSYWLLGHLKQFRRYAAIIVMAIEGIIILFALIQFSGYVYFVIVRNQRLILPLRQSALLQSREITIPDPLVQAYGAVAHGQGQYDLYAQLKNQNQGWRADFDFIYSANGVEQPPLRVFLLPLEQKYVLKLGVAATTVPQISYRIANIGWRRLSAQDVRAIADRSHFAVADTQLLTDTRSLLGAGETRLLFTLTNNSIYKYWDFRVPVVMKQGGAVSGIALVPVFSIDRDERKTLEARWEYAISATAFEIAPDIDILNEAALRPSL
jgi:hypothetical protein